MLILLLHCCSFDDDSKFTEVQYIYSQTSVSICIQMVFTGPLRIHTNQCTQSLHISFLRISCELKIQLAVSIATSYSTIVSSLRLCNSVLVYLVLWCACVHELARSASAALVATTLALCVLTLAVTLQLFVSFVATAQHNSQLKANRNHQQQEQANLIIRCQSKQSVVHVCLCSTRVYCSSGTMTTPNLGVSCHT
jgi:hypothetical protein